MEDILSIFVRDELLTWHSSLLRNSGTVPPELSEENLLTKLSQNVELVFKRAQTLACIKDREKAAETNIPLIQSILDLVSCAVNPQKLAQMDPHWHPWL
jgi:phosphatidylinositol kinase/protein kinase (PI-3  family)